MISNSGGVSLSNLVNNILLQAHPVGSYYWSEDSTNPAALFGGTWIQIKDKFIIAVGDSHTAGTSYGSNTKDISHTHSIGHTHGVPGVAHTHTTGNHTLTVTEMPSHTHAFRAVRDVANSDSMGSLPKANNGQGANSGWSEYVTITGNYANQNTGGGGAHNHGNTGSTTPSATTTNSQSTSTSGSGGSTTLDITPACIAAYCWKRTA